MCSGLLRILASADSSISFTAFVDIPKTAAMSEWLTPEPSTTNLSHHPSDISLSISSIGSLCIAHHYTFSATLARFGAFGWHLFNNQRSTCCLSNIDKTICLIMRDVHLPGLRHISPSASISSLVSPCMVHRYQKRAIKAHKEVRDAYDFNSPLVPLCEHVHGKRWHKP